MVLFWFLFDVLLLTEQEKELGALCGQLPLRAVEQSCAFLIFHQQAFVRVHKAVLILFGFLCIFRFLFSRNKSGSFRHSCLDKQMWLVDLLCVSFLDLKIIWLKKRLGDTVVFPLQWDLSLHILAEF